MMSLLFVLLLQVNVGDARHRATVVAFEKLTGYPHGRPGFVVDHILPLCAGGADAVSNMQWQPVKLSYEKDKFERALCAAMKKQGYVLAKAATP